MPRARRRWRVWEQRLVDELEQQCWSNVYGALLMTVKHHFTNERTRGYLGYGFGLCQPQTC
jgi:hypothetical protein